MELADVTVCSYWKNLEGHYQTRRGFCKRLLAISFQAHQFCPGRVQQQAAFASPSVFPVIWNGEAVRVLGIDTTSKQGSLAWIEEGETPVTVSFEGGQKHSLHLFGAVERLLRERNRSLAEIDIFGVATGPGSFTGIRVGLAAIKGWAETLQKPVAGISVLEAMVALGNPPTPWAVPIVNGGRGELYVAFFRSLAAGSRFQMEGEATVISDEDFPARLREKFSRQDDATLLTRADQDLEATLNRIGCEGFLREEIRRPLAQAVAALAAEGVEGRRVGPAEELRAFYIRRPDAELHWKED